VAGVWSKHSVAGKAVEVFDPARPPRFGILFLHAETLDTIRGRPAFEDLLDQFSLACVCPHVGRSWWLDRVCSEFDRQLTAERHLLDNVLPLFKTRWELSPRSVGILGIGMGGQGALRLGFKYPQLFNVVAGIASALDFHELYGNGTPLDELFDSKEQARQDTTVLQMRQDRYSPHIFFCIDPDDADWQRSNDRLHEKLSALGIPHTIDFETQAGGHSWQYFDRMAEPALRFLVDGLEKESRRLL
jgi:S-formylglutathione hydrolase